MYSPKPKRPRCVTGGLTTEMTRTLASDSLAAKNVGADGRSTPANVHCLSSQTPISGAQKKNSSLEAQFKAQSDKYDAMISNLKANQETTDKLLIEALSELAIHKKLIEDQVSRLDAIEKSVQSMNKDQDLQLNSVTAEPQANECYIKDLQSVKDQQLDAQQVVQEKTQELLNARVADIEILVKQYHEAVEKKQREQQEHIMELQDEVNLWSEMSQVQNRKAARKMQKQNDKIMDLEAKCVSHVATK